MNAPLSSYKLAPAQSWREQVESACAQACSMIAPAWPLDRAIAVNPHWQRIAMPVREVAARMAVLGDTAVFAPRADILKLWQQGRLQAEHVQQALERLALTDSLSLRDCMVALEQEAGIEPLPLLIDLLDCAPDRQRRLSWRDAVTHQMSQTCAAYFDENQADWQPERSAGLYQFWRENLIEDLGIAALMGLPELHKSLKALPLTREDAERWVLKRLGLPAYARADYLEALLLTVNGWASWCAYLGWQAQLEGAEDGHLRDLLAIRLAWGAILLEASEQAQTAPLFEQLQQAWTGVPDRLEQAQHALAVDEVWQLALELSYQDSLCQRLAYPAALSPEKPRVQAAFCIDVRSEPIRRALESVSPAIQTLGFAGFFGLPIAYTPIATEARRPQLPGLLAPLIEVTEQLAPRENDGDQLPVQAARQQRLQAIDQEHRLHRWPGAAFSFVEAVGLGYLATHWRWLRPSTETRTRDHLHGLPKSVQQTCRPQLQAVPLKERTNLAKQVLNAMGLSTTSAEIVVLVGHGSQSRNNAQAAALECGACCGQSGEVNSRTLAQLLNDPEVREQLVNEGLRIDSKTYFAAALHNTTTDELELFDADLMPEHTQPTWCSFAKDWDMASDQVRRERAPSLGLDPRRSARDMLETLKRRANDGAQTRPEWGLANNAAFIIAPRARTRGVVLEGRSFLHDYSAKADPDGLLLEQLMTAPMLVTHWINWQYHASRVAPKRFGSGNKLLHNVVGGNLGLFEGNGGDLRIGLARQSLHNGDDWVHEPLRLSVFIDAPRAQIERVLQSHKTVGDLVENGWLHLMRFNETGVEAYQQGGWR